MFFGEVYKDAKEGEAYECIHACTEAFTLGKIYYTSYSEDGILGLITNTGSILATVNSKFKKVEDKKNMYDVTKTTYYVTRDGKQFHNEEMAELWAATLDYCDRLVSLIDLPDVKSLSLVVHCAMHPEPTKKYEFSMKSVVFETAKKRGLKPCDIHKVFC